IVKVMGDQRVEELDLALEACVERADGVAGFLRQLRDRNRLELAMREQPEARRDQRVVGFLSPLLLDPLASRSRVRLTHESESLFSLQAKRPAPTTSAR